MLYIILFFIALMIFPASFSSSAWNAMHRKKKGKKYVTTPMSSFDMVLGILPFGSACVTHKAFYDEYGWTKYVAPMAPICFAYELVVTLSPLSTNRWLLFSALIVFWIGVAIMQLLYTIVYFDIAHMFTFSFVTYVFIIIIPEVTACYLTSQVPRQMLAVEASVDDRFSGDNQQS